MPALKNPEGTQLINQTKDPTKWATAAAASKAWLDEFYPARYSLYTETDGSGNADPYLIVP